MTSFNIKTKQDTANVKKELMKRKLSDKIDKQNLQDHIYKMNEPSIKPINEMKNQIEETIAVLRAIKTDQIKINQK